MLPKGPFQKAHQVTRNDAAQALFSKGTPQEMAEHLTKVAQGHPYSSYDDVTIIVAKIEYDTEGPK